MSQLQNHFRFIANNLSLDFLNTVVMRDGRSYDMLKTSDDLARWFAAAEISVADKINNTVFAKALSLRSAIRHSIDALGQGLIPNQDKIDIINTALKHRTQSHTLRITDQSIQLQTTVTHHSPLSALSNIAFSAAELLTNENPKRIKSCSNKSCVLVFHDTSKSGRRRWCSMDLCGNRAKASKHYQTHKGL